MEQDRCLQAPQAPLAKGGCPRRGRGDSILRNRSKSREYRLVRHVGHIKFMRQACFSSPSPFSFSFSCGILQTEFVCKGWEFIGQRHTDWYARLWEEHGRRSSGQAAGLSVPGRRPADPGAGGRAAPGDTGPAWDAGLSGCGGAGGGQSGLPPDGGRPWGERRVPGGGSAPSQGAGAGGLPPGPSGGAGPARPESFHPGHRHGAGPDPGRRDGLP